ncbi:NADP-dependent oxidoreductase [Glycomyces tritici]|uniref:NADP-dependent oxidoreductase n=1 Tax=Glycomyces tritici TaxID=2665176 RepID=A0ABT7YSJ3_9ACTN|nr:NADP-dependent oxidoreductase [Glycomyces tritici]MDN3241611.1 NADP-dependent oxidoreductase [Glycomyces tritici]
MKAVVANDYGPPEDYTVADIPTPRPGPGQIQVRIAAASVNPADVQVPSGEFREQFPLEFPHVPGNDFAGTVSEVGPGVAGFEVGDEVFGQAVPRALRTIAGTERPSLTTGTLAEYAVFEADTPFIAPRPQGISVEDAAALPTVGLTVRAMLASVGIAPGSSALVVGATGGVGTALLPALAALATVTATAKPEDADLVRGLGAAAVIGYGAAEYPSDVDVAFNLALPGDRLTEVAAALRPGGRLVTITFPVTQPEWLGRDDVDLRFVLDMDGRLGGMAEVGEAAARGELAATIGRRYSLDQGPQAVADFARRHTFGKLVVRVDAGLGPVLRIRPARSPARCVVGRLDATPVCSGRWTRIPPP